MIPKFTTSGVLPPYTGDSPADKAKSSPFDVKMTEFVERFATSLPRIVILEGLLNYREKLRSLEFTEGFQWIDGSFVEDCESVNNRGRAPADVDLVTYAYRPLDEQGGYLENVELMNIVKQNFDIFDPTNSKATYQCDAYFVDLCQPAHSVVKVTAYWYGLFSHSRVSSLWKGILNIALASDDDHARVILEMKKREFLLLCDNLTGGI